MAGQMEGHWISVVRILIPVRPRLAARTAQFLYKDRD